MNIIEVIKKLGMPIKKEAKPRDFEWERFQQAARSQFRKLSEKGLSIPVFTL